MAPTIGGASFDGCSALDPGVIAIVFNPTARGDKATAFRARLQIAARKAQAAGQRVIMKPTRSAGDAVHQAATAVAEGFSTIVAAGGDGTVNEVANGIAQIPDGPQRARLGILPLGTVNVFAKELRIPALFDDAWQGLSQGTERSVDLGVADFAESATGAPVRRWFVQMAGAGLDSLAVAKVNWAFKKKVGPLAYVWAGLQTLMSPLPVVEVNVDGQRARGQLALVGNGRFYGGRWVVFPGASLADGILDLALVERISPVRFCLQFAALAQGRFEGAAGLVHLQGREITLRAADPSAGAIPFHVEGDNVGVLPVRFSIDPRPIRVLGAR